MAVTREQNIFRMRDLCDNPYPQAPVLHQFVRQELDEEQDICNELNNTGKAWMTDTVDVVSDGTQDTYEIDSTNFGKPLFVVKATNDTQTPFVSVPFTEITSHNYGQIWNWNSPLPNPTIEKMAFYRAGAVDQTNQVRIQPLPQNSATYTITYLVGYIGTDDPLASAFALPEHATLLQLRGAMAMLPYCKWYEDVQMNLAKKQELAASFEYQLGRKERLFKEYIASLVHARAVDCDDWR